jgi:putative hemolysin
VTTAAAIIAISILLEAFFSGAEIALLSADKVKLRHRAEEQNRRQEVILSFLDDPGELISTALVGTTSCVVLSTVVSTLAFLRNFPHQAELLSLAAVTPLVLVFGEILPKSVFQNHADAVAPKVIYALWFFRTLFYPVVALGAWLSELFLKVLGLTRERALMSRKELSLLIRLPSREGADRITPDERRMVTRLFEFKDTTVRDVMIPLSEVTALPCEASLDEVAAEIADKQHTRLPLYRERLDQIVGIVHAFDVLRAKGEVDLATLCRPAIFVPESQLALATLVRLQREGQGMAVVVDEYGGATGVVTIEDVLEEIVGEIEDEFDKREPELIVREPGGTYRVAGRVPVERLNERLKLGLPVGDEYESVAGLMLDRLKRIPAAGEQVVVEGVVLVATKVNERSIEEVRVRPGRKR